jgi:RNA polymerase sigma-70 factor (ECF subfamily)
MHELDGFTVPEIADAIGVPLNTAYSHLRRARAEVQDAARRMGLLEVEASHEQP